jgi:polar amino acid transport system permease protein
LWKYRVSILQGWWVTLLVSAGALIGSCLVAAALVAGQRSAVKTIRWFTQGFVEIVRGMPLLSLVLIGFYVVLNNLTISRALDSLGLGGKLFSGILLLSVFTGAYLTEILRGGLDSISQAQLDSARAVGFNFYPVVPELQRVRNIKRMDYEIQMVKSNMTQSIKDRSLTPEKRASIREEFVAELKRRRDARNKYIQESALPAEFSRRTKE